MACQLIPIALVRRSGVLRAVLRFTRMSRFVSHEPWRIRSSYKAPQLSA